MKTIKIYLNEDGSFRNGLTPDFILNQYSWQDTLINVYVPTTIIDLETGSTGVVAMFKSYDSEGELVEEISSNKYNFAFVRRNVYRPNDAQEYALFERIMPKQMTLYAGQQVLIINTVVYNLDNEITNIVTSGEQTYNVVASGIAEESEEETDLSTIQAEINAIKQNAIRLDQVKQDKVDYQIQVYMDKTHTTTTVNVAVALNSLNARLSPVETQVDINTQDIADLKNTLILDINYLGTHYDDNAPTQASLTIVGLELKGSALKNGDEVIWVERKQDATDVIWKAIYTANSNWSYYAVPSIEVANNTTLGIIQGTTANDEKNVIVDINNGKIIEIYLKSSTGYITLSTAYDSLVTQVNNILNGTTPPALADKANKDSSGNNIIQTYQTKTEGATKSFVRDYAMPNLFNDVMYFNFTNGVISKEKQSDSEQTKDISQVGYTKINTFTFDIQKYAYQLSNNNMMSIVMNYAITNGQIPYHFVFVLEKYEIGSQEPKVLCTYTTEDKTSGSGLQTISFDSNLNELENGEVIEITPTSTSYLMLQIYFVQNQSQARQLTWLTPTYLSTFSFSVAKSTVTFIEGTKGEQYKYVTSTYNEQSGKVTYVTNAINELVDGSDHYFELLNTSNTWETTNPLITITHNGIEYPLITKKNSTETTATFKQLICAKCYNGNAYLNKLRFKAQYIEDNGNAYFILDDTNTKEIEYRVQSLEINSATREDNAKSLYHLGAYDSYVDNDDGTTTITRQTGYVKGGDYTSTGTTQSGRLVYYYQNSITNRVYTDIVNNLSYEARDTTNWWQTGANLDSTKGYISYDNENSFIVVIPPVNTIPSDNLQIQYKLATSYQEKVIPNQPLNTLDTNGSEWVREEWEKSLNVLSLQDVPTTTVNGVTYSVNNGVITLNGTSNIDRWIRVPLKTNISSGQYYFANFGDRVNLGISASNGMGGSDEWLVLNANTSFIFKSEIIYFAFAIYNTTSYNNLIIKPMLVKGSIPPTLYQPYNANKHITNDDVKFVEDIKPNFYQIKKFTGTWGQWVNTKGNDNVNVLKALISHDISEDDYHYIDLIKTYDSVGETIKWVYLNSGSSSPFHDVLDNSEVIIYYVDLYE